jgi:hypothetical protein
MSTLCPVIERIQLTARIAHMHVPSFAAGKVVDSLDRSGA